MFRAEVLESMGLPPDLKVYGWGLSLERPTMISKFSSAVQANTCGPSDYNEAVVLSHLQQSTNNIRARVQNLQYPRTPRPQGGSQLHREERCGETRQELEGAGLQIQCQQLQAIATRVSSISPR